MLEPAGKNIRAGKVFTLLDRKKRLEIRLLVIENHHPLATGEFSSVCCHRTTINEVLVVNHTRVVRHDWRGEGVPFRNSGGRCNALAILHEKLEPYGMP